MERYEVQEHLGDGTFGEVFRALHKVSHREVAVKRMKRDFRDWDECVQLRELQSLMALSRHPNIVQLYEVLRETDKRLYFVFEYMPDGNLYEFIKKCTPRKSASSKPLNLLTEAKIQSITKQIFQGLAYMHAKGFVHRDIKPENLLLRGDVCKVADFGLARESSSPYPLTDYVSTRWYRAPEVLLRSPRYGTPVDLFAVGCIVAELYSRLPLFPGKTEVDQIAKIVQVLGAPTIETWPEGVRLAARLHFQFPSVANGSQTQCKSERQVQSITLEKRIPTAPPTAIQLMKDLLYLDPARRPSASQALHDPYFSNANATTASPTVLTMAEITESAEKHRSLKLVTASPGASNGRNDIRVLGKPVDNSRKRPRCDPTSHVYPSASCIGNCSPPTLSNPYKQKHRRFLGSTNFAS